MVEKIAYKKGTNEKSKYGCAVTLSARYLLHYEQLFSFRHFVAGMHIHRVQGF